jgi:nitroreductase
MMFTVDRVMGRGSLLDYGTFMQNLMLAARARGLHTCPQAAWNSFGSIVLPHIGAGEQEMMVCGMALGYANPDELVNTFYTPRVGVESYTTWLE